MSLNAAALRLMAEKGLSALDIVEIVEAMEAGAPKSSGAERQKRYRDKLRNACDVTSDVTRDGNAVTEAPLSSPSPFLPPDPQQTPTPAYPREITPHARKADDFPKPEWADQQVWADFMANRKAKKARNTVTAYRGFLNDIEKFTCPNWPPGRLLEYAAAKGWAGIYEPEKDDRNGTRSNQPAVRQAANGLRGPRPDPAIDLLRQAQAERAAGFEQDEGGDSDAWAALPAYLTDRS